jgi:hypothetical protein
MEGLVENVLEDLQVPRPDFTETDLVARYTASVIKSRDLLIDQARAQLNVAEARKLYHDAYASSDAERSYLKARLAEAKVSELQLTLQILEIERFVSFIGEYASGIVDQSREAEVQYVAHLAAKYMQGL